MKRLLSEVRRLDVSAEAANNASLSIMQFNVLNHMFTSEGDEDFKRRKLLNLNFISSLRPAICLLEEVDDVTDYSSHLQRAGYSIIAHNKFKAAMDFTLLAFDPSRIRMHDYEVLRFRGANDCGMSQFAIIAEMSFIDGTHFVFVGQHAVAGRTEEKESARISCSVQLFNFLQKNFLSPGRATRVASRIIWVGDMNAGPHTYGNRWPARWFPFVTSLGAVSQQDPKVVNSFASFTSAYADGNGSEPALTTCKVRDGELIAQAIDYVMFPVGSCRTVGFAVLPEAAEELAPRYLPSPDWGSDHLAVYVELAFSPVEHQRTSAM